MAPNILVISKGEKAMKQCIKSFQP